MVATDSRHFADISPNIYRFVPWWLTEELGSTIHGTNERIAVDNLALIVRYYVQLIRNAAS